MKKLIYLIIYITLCMVAACSDNPSYHIGVSQCSEDDWRALLNIEIEREARFFGDIDIENIAANDNSQQQIADIEHFIEEGKDLIIVAPNVAEDIQPAIEKAYDKGIPVILIDRRIRGNKYNAFIGADNKAIGKAVGEYICQHAAKRPVNIVELCGLQGSTPEQERHYGFANAISHLSSFLSPLTSVYANWNETQAKTATDSILKLHNNIDYIFAHNDRMALGAYKAVKAAGREKQIKILGVDGLVTPNGGVDMVLNKQMLATHTYPTGGSEAIQLAHKILKGEHYEREIVLPSALVDSSNARVMHLQYISMKNLDDKYLKMEALTDRQLEKINQQQWMLGGAIVIIILLTILPVMMMRVRKEKRQADEIMMMQLQTPINPLTQNDAQKENQTSNKDNQDDAFRRKVEEIIIAHIGDSDFSVNDIAAELGMSRVQLYRKIKAASDQNVSDLIRNARLEKAKELLTSTNKTISEVAYAVGFSSPSYFTKCFKEQFGITPSSTSTSTPTS